jgi:hypothetical protein
MAKKKEAVTLDLNIKMAAGKSKAAKSDRLVIDSPVTTIANPNFDQTRKVSANNPEEIEIPTVDRCIAINQEIESLASQLKLYEAEVIETAQDAKKSEADDNDNFVKTIDVKGSELKLQIQFRDAYSKMDITMRDPLKQIFGDSKYAIMFTEETNHAIRPEKVEALKEILGDRFADFFKTEECVKPSKEFQYNYFAMRKSLKADQLATIQKVLDACQSKPSVKYPK